MESLWKQFLETGSISDYLKYSNQQNQRSEEKRPEVERQDDWVKNNARLAIGNGHGDQDRTNWRIR